MFNKLLRTCNKSLTTKVKEKNSICSFFNTFILYFSIEDTARQSSFFELPFYKIGQYFT